MLNFVKKVFKKERSLDQYKLCFIDYGPTAYFTTSKLADQEGEKWYHLNYEYEAGAPYGSGDNSKIIKIKFESSFKTPDEICSGRFSGRFSGYSVVEINKKLVPWLTPEDYTKSPKPIFAGETLPEFVKKIIQSGGEVYLPHYLSIFNNK